MFYKTGVGSVIATSDAQLDLFNKEADKTDETKEENCDCTIKADSQSDSSV